MQLTFALLVLAIVSVWLPPLSMSSGRQWVMWPVPFVAALVTGAASQLLGWQGVLVILLMWIAAWASTAFAGNARGAWIALAAATSLVLASHEMPGFESAVIAQQVRVSVDSAAMTVVANFDKGAAGLILLAFYCRRIQRWSEVPRVVAIGIGVGALTAGFVISIAIAVDVIHFSPKVPSFSGRWVLGQLFLTCLMEEALFRGIVQERLSQSMSARSQARHVPLLLASVLFGLAHFSGGPALILAATLAGLGYGTAYAATRRIEAAVLAHLSFNSIHFFFFTYPYAVR